MVLVEQTMTFEKVLRGISKTDIFEFDNTFAFLCIFPTVLLQLSEDGARVPGFNNQITAWIEPIRAD